MATLLGIIQLLKASVESDINITLHPNQAVFIVSELEKLLGENADKPDVSKSKSNKKRFVNFVSAMAFSHDVYIDPEQVIAVEKIDHDEVSTFTNIYLAGGKVIPVTSIIQTVVDHLGNIELEERW